MLEDGEARAPAGAQWGWGPPTPGPRPQGTGGEELSGTAPGFHFQGPFLVVCFVCFPLETSMLGKQSGGGPDGARGRGWLGIPTLAALAPGPSRAGMLTPREACPAVSTTSAGTSRGPWSRG